MLESKYLDAEVEVFDNSLEDENGLYCTLQISVGITLEDSTFIDYQTSFNGMGKPCSRLVPYVDGLDKPTDKLVDMLDEIGKHYNVQEKYDEYIDDNYKIIDPAIDWDTRDYNFLAKKIKDTK